MWNSFKLWFFTIWFFIKKIPFFIKIKTLDKKAKDKKIFLAIKEYDEYILKKLKITVKISGKENLSDNNVLYVSNHGSILDPYFVFKAINVPVSFFIAGEFEYVLKVPFLGLFFRTMENVFVNRESVKEGIKSIQEGTKVLGKGSNLFIFPEGEITHLLTDEKIAEFKPGSFKCALKAQKGITPITIIGSRNIQEKVSLFGKINSGTVEIVIHPVIEYDTIKDKTTSEISTMCQKEVLSSL